MRVCDVAGCQGCPMAAKFPDNTFVPPKKGTGHRLVVGEAPGEDESRAAEPFVGKAGHLVDSWLHSVGEKRSTLWISNVLSCRPPDNVFPTDSKARAYIPLSEAHAAVTQCWRNHLLPLLRSRPWERVYLFGVKALERVTQKKGLYEWAGTPLPIPELDPLRRVAIATLHPAAIMRDPSMRPLVFCDLKRSLSLPPENYLVDPAPQTLTSFYDRPFVIDIETDIPPTRIHIVSLSNERYTATVIHPQGHYVEALRALLAQAREVITQNGIQFDAPMLRSQGFPLSLNPDECVHWDLMLMHHLLYPNLPHDLGLLGRQFTQKPYWKDWRGAGDQEEVYAGRDADGEWQIYEVLRSYLERHPRLLRLYHNVQVPLARICHWMTSVGVMTDPTAAKKLGETADGILAEQEALLPASMRSQMLTKRRRIPAPEGTLSPPRYGKKGQLLKQKPVKWTHEDYQVPSTSPWRNGPATAQFLYGELGLTQRLDGKGKVTTGKVALALAASEARKQGKPEVVAQVNAVRELRRWASRKTVCEKLSKGAAKRLHVSFNVQGTASGRLSCSGDGSRIQLQNVTDEMRVIFVPSHPDWRLISIDFSQMEARLTAWFANDTVRAARFNTPGYNEYSHAASIFLGIPMEEVKPEKDPEAPYHRAKIIVLGMDRALGPRKIAMQNNIPEREVKEMQAKWRSQIPATITWQVATGEQAQRDKFLWNPFGRRGVFNKGHEYTEGISYLPQSTGADVIFRSMIAMMHERIEWPRSRVEPLVPLIRTLPEPARLLIQVHDELVFEAPASQVDEVIATCREVMGQPWPELNGLALPVNAAVGKNWFEMKKV